jgi:hypothetical protein
VQAPADAAAAAIVKEISASEVTKNEVLDYLEANA